MEVDNTPQDLGQENAIPVEDIQAPDVKIADSSTPEFYNENFEDSNSESPKSDTKDVEIKESSPGTESEEKSVESSYEGNNQYVSAISKWSQEKGYDLDLSNIDEESFGEEEMNKLVGKTQAMNFLESEDAHLHNIVKQGVSLNDYIDSVVEMRNTMATPDDRLVKGDLFSKMSNHLQSINVIKPEEDGSFSEESIQKIVNSVENQFKQLPSEQVGAMANSIRNTIQESINTIPEHLKGRRESQQKQSLEDFNNRRKGYIDKINSNIDKSKKIVTAFSDQSEKNDFKQFVDEMTSVKEIDFNGKKVTAAPLIHEIQNNSETLIEVLRFLHLKKNGYFTDKTNNARKAAFGELGLNPIVGKDKGGKSKSSSYNGVRIADTSQGEY